MTLKTALLFISVAILGFAGCLDRKSTESDASSSGEAGMAIDGNGQVAIDSGHSVGIEAGSTGAFDMAAAITDASRSFDLFASLDLNPDFEASDLAQQTPEAGSDIASDLPHDANIQTIPDLAPDILSQPVPDVASDAPILPDATPDTTSGGCVIGGTSYANGAELTGNFCQYCNPSNSTSAWSKRDNGTACGDGEVCYGGNCQTGCWISGSLVGNGATNSTNTCQICKPLQSTSDWVNNDAATAISCGGCDGTAACSNQKLGACSKDTATYYEDNDGDGYGNAAVSVVACSAPTGYVKQSGDCADGNPAIYPNVVQCIGGSDYNTLQTCGSDGNFINTNCPNGCTHAQCKSLATISTAGLVTCGSTQCSTSVGCSYTSNSISGPSPVCGNPNSSSSYAKCDGPNDCASGQVCCYSQSSGGGAQYMECVASTSCPYTNLGGSGMLVCDPSQSSPCSSGTCTLLNASYLFAAYVCK